MNEQNVLSLNLASHPFRNRRLFLTIAGALGLLAAALLVWGGTTFFLYRGRERQANASRAEAEQRLATLKRQEQQFGAKATEAGKELKEQVDIFNNIILGKKFSWVEFLSMLETGLPATSYIISLEPSPALGARTDVSFRVVSPSLDELVKVVQNLNDLGFQRLRVEKERVDERGRTVAEIFLSYEKMD
jgi:hypothetical protein